MIVQWVKIEWNASLVQFSTDNALKLGFPEQQNQTIEGTNALIETVILQCCHRSLSFIQ